MRPWKRHSGGSQASRKQPKWHFRTGWKFSAFRRVLTCHLRPFRAGWEFSASRWVLTGFTLEARGTDWEVSPRISSSALRIPTIVTKEFHQWIFTFIDKYFEQSMLTVTLVRSKEDRTACLESKQTLYWTCIISSHQREKGIIIVSTRLRLENRGSFFLYLNKNPLKINV